MSVAVKPFMLARWAEVCRTVVALTAALLLCQFHAFSSSADSIAVVLPDEPALTTADGDRHKFNPEEPIEVDADAAQQFNADFGVAVDLDTVPVPDPYAWVEREVAFNPDPTKAVWMSALFPGLGQIYNRRYWKLPLIAGGYLGLAYATSWNNSMLRDYTVAFADLMDSDPTTKSYMDFFPPNVTEDSLDRTWLQNILQSRKNYFRRNRDLCIIAMVGVYLLAMVDAYVDASLSHFDISPDLSLDVTPTLMRDDRSTTLPSVGLQWALNF